MILINIIPLFAKEWMRLEFVESLRAAEDRERWKSIVAMSAVMPRQLRG